MVRKVIDVNVNLNAAGGLVSLSLVALAGFGVEARRMVAIVQGIFLLQKVNLELTY